VRTGKEEILVRKLLAVALVGSLILALVPSAALAGDSHAVRNRWTGGAIGAGAVALGGILYTVLQGSGTAAGMPSAYGAPPVATTPPVVYSPPPAVVYVPPIAVDYRAWVPGHYEDRWVPLTERQRAWVDGHYENGWWVPGHWQDQVRDVGYWTRVWVEGYWR
jgi:hypothetical protein